MKFSVKRYWEVCDSVEVDANSVRDAIDIAHELPVDSSKAEFVSDSMNTDSFCDVQLSNAGERIVKRYEGDREGYAVDVTVDGRSLSPRLDLWNHSPSGFEWGYGGSGPAQLALALLADHLGDDEQAVALHQSFKFAVVSKLPKRGWSLTSQEVDEALSALPTQP